MVISRQQLKFPSYNNGALLPMIPERIWSGCNDLTFLSIVMSKYCSQRAIRDALQEEYNMRSFTDTEYPGIE